VIIPRDSRGHFLVNGRVDGKRLGFMVDTGASVIALTARDARPGSASVRRCVNSLPR
jgi:clan AA aspartic protease (TIGR02281 family)